MNGNFKAISEIDSIFNNNGGLYANLDTESDAMDDMKLIEITVRRQSPKATDDNKPFVVLKSEEELMRENRSIQEMTDEL